MIRNNLRVVILISLSWSARAANDELANLRQMYDGTMLPGVEVATFSHSDKLQPVRVVHRGKSSLPLPKRAKPFPAIHFDNQGHHYDLYDYLAHDRVAGILVLKTGRSPSKTMNSGSVRKRIGFQCHWLSRLPRR